ncbi:hypothetical protein ACOSQ3_013534 [Xanthoceras sorbifolium]
MGHSRLKLWPITRSMHAVDIIYLKIENQREIAKSNRSFSEFRRRRRRKKCFFDVKWNLRAVKHSSVSFLLDLMYSIRLFWG